MAYGKCIVGRRVPGAEARPAKTGFYNSAGFQELFRQTIFHRSEIHRSGCGIDREIKFSVADALSFQNIRCLGEIVIHTAAAAHDYSLRDMYLSVLPDVSAKVKPDLSVQGAVTFFLCSAQDFFRVRLQFMNGICFGGMERQRNHALHFIQVDADHCVVISTLCNTQRRIVLWPSDIFIPGFYGFVRFPDRRKAAGFRRHHVNADPEVHTQRSNSRPGEFQYPVFDKSLGESFLYQRQRHIVRADAVRYIASHPDQHHFRLRHIISVLQQLLDEFSPALSDAERSVTSIPRMRIAPEDHASACSQFFPCELMNHSLICRHIDSAVFFCCRQAEHMVILIYCSSDSTEAVMAVGQCIWNRKGFQPRCSCRLNNPDRSNIMGNERIKPDFQCLSAV